MADEEWRIVTMGKAGRYRKALEVIVAGPLVVPEGWGAREWYRTVAYEHVGVAASALEDEGELDRPSDPPQVHIPGLDQTEWEG